MRPLTCSAAGLRELARRITNRINRMLEDFEDLSLVRPGRTYPRNHRPPRIYAPAYKPIA